MANRKFKVELGVETIRDMLRLLEYSSGGRYPFLTDRLYELERNLRDILIKGCFKHSVIMMSIRVSPNEIITFCPICNPEYMEKGVKHGRK